LEQITLAEYPRASIVTSGSGKNLLAKVQKDLGGFTCATGSHFTDEVQTFFRASAVHRLHRQAARGAELILFRDADGALIAAGFHEETPLIAIGEERATLITAIALSVKFHGARLPDETHLSDYVFQAGPGPRGASRPRKRRNGNRSPRKRAKSEVMRSKSNGHRAAVRRR
jgi:hypothetical protein